MEGKKQIQHTPQTAQLKIEHFCAYQERCHKEVKDKLYTYGLNSTEVNEILEKLVRKGFLNEQRFANAFVGGKFRQKKWGKNKIIRELQTRQINETCIRKALKEIEDSDYTITIEKTAIKYAKNIKTGNIFTQKQKTLKYLLSRGFEYEQCHTIVNTLFDGK